MIRAHRRISETTYADGITVKRARDDFLYIHLDLPLHIRDPYVQTILETLTMIWWLVTWALLASEVASWNFYDGFKFSYLSHEGKTSILCAKIAAGLGALEWLLFSITLVVSGEFQLSFSILPSYSGRPSCNT